jgi:hypothetical protein
VIETKPRPRTLDQNARMWAMLADVANQVPWPVNGREQRMAPQDWKHVFTAALKREQRIAAGIDGGFVMLGQSTSRMTVAELGDLMELMSAFGAERGVKWSDPNEP